MTTSNPSPVSRRHLLGGAAALTTATAVGAAALPAAASLADDAPLFDLCHRRKEWKQVARRLGQELDALCEGRPTRQWTPEEKAAHRIRRDADKQSFVSLKDIEDNNAWDDPRRDRSEHEKTDDGTTTTMVWRWVKVTATEEEIAAWRDRCAARRALYDAKEAAYEQHMEASGYLAANRRAEAAWTEHDRLTEEIKEYRPLTLAGVLAKMRIYQDESGEDFAGDPEELEWVPKLFLSALDDLERLAGHKAERMEVCHA